MKFVCFENPENGNMMLGQHKALIKERDNEGRALEGHSFTETK